MAASKYLGTSRKNLFKDGKRFTVLFTYKHQALMLAHEVMNLLQLKMQDGEWIKSVPKHAKVYRFQNTAKAYKFITDKKFDLENILRKELVIKYDENELQENVKPETIRVKAKRWANSFKKVLKRN